MIDKTPTNIYNLNGNGRDRACLFIIEKIKVFTK